MKINQLRSFCPSDANFSGDFTFKENQLVGHLKIHFSSGQFEAHCSEGSAREGMDAIETEVRKQIAVWRDIRFDQKEKFVEFKDKVKRSV